MILLSNYFNARLLGVCLFLMCIIKDGFSQDGLSPIYMDNTNLEGVPGQRFIHMHNQAGIRIEYNLNRQKLVLWTSPLADKSRKASDRNFSNRDDHTSIFDFIGFPSFDVANFINCDYDPFYSRLNFKNNTIHILSIIDKPIVVVWFDHDDLIDVKTDKQDTVTKRDEKVLESYHFDRGKTFRFWAGIGASGSKAWHQPVHESGRSHYSRFHLSGQDALYIYGDQYHENDMDSLLVIARQTPASLIKRNEHLIAMALSTGKISVRNNPELQRIIDLNRRVLLAMQDRSGSLRAALRHIYYLIWHRDGGMVSSLNAYCGWTEPLQKWNQFILENPTVNDKGERFFGQLVSPITKLEEDGPFYGIWSFFTYYTQTGDRSLITSENLKVLEDNISWLENNYYDTGRGLFFRYHYGEAPYYTSPGDGYDAAVGNATKANFYTWKGDTITQAFDFYINSLMYSSYVMLSAVEEEEKSMQFLEKAKLLKKRMQVFYAPGKTLPDYGELITVDRQSIIAEAPGPDDADYQWALGLPFFSTKYIELAKYRGRIADELLNHPQQQFLAGWYSNLTSLDTEFYAADKIEQAIRYVIPQISSSGKCLPMPYTIPEIVDVNDCDIYHDVRPQPFSISAYLASIVNLGVKRFPFGISIRGTDFLDSITNYSYKGKLINFRYSGVGNTISEIKVNGRKLLHSYQLPEDILNRNVNTVEVKMKAINPSINNILIGSTVSLGNINNKGWSVDAHGVNILLIKRLDKQVSVRNEKGESIPFYVNYSDDIAYVEFEGKGRFLISFL